ncbi:MAG TPA: FeoB-associated Cys-rich membrane protein [Pyrinomonadaceae bacterium]|nr:FeoB-associated Cys-rich membrane protein [Pyrinomonadaceae bacterium]
MFDWQTIAVVLIILAALAYVARRALSRLRSFRLSKRQGAPSCSTGCGACGEAKQPARTAPTFVRISPSAKTPRRRTR